MDNRRHFSKAIADERGGGEIEIGGMVDKGERNTPAFVSTLYVGMISCMYGTYIALSLMYMNIFNRCLFYVYIDTGLGVSFCRNRTKQIPPDILFSPKSLIDYTWDGSAT